MMIGPLPLLLIALAVLLLVLHTLKRRNDGLDMPDRTCPRCHAEMPPHARFCARCGRQLY